MNTSSFILITLPTLIWSSTWFVIKFQVGVVDPMVSVFYRYALAGFLMLSFCLVTRRKLRYSIKLHALFLLEGLCLFGLNYWLVYIAELHLTSGLIAVIFSLIVFFNIIFGKLLLKTRIRIPVLLAGLLGMSGIGLIFKREIGAFSFSDQSFMAIILCFVSLLLASLGNIMAVKISKHDVKVIEANTFGMLYGALSMFLLTLITGKAFEFEMSLSYISSLFYLVVFGSIVAFACYIKTVIRIGPDRAAYALIMIPIISMLISSIFESYTWDNSSLLGICLIVLGNILMLRTK